jgi:hypothetical protein
MLLETFDPLSLLTAQVWSPVMFDPLSTPSGSLERLGPKFRHAPYETVAELKECDDSVIARAIGHINIAGSSHIVGDDAMDRESPDAGCGILGVDRDEALSPAYVFA